MSVVSGQDPGDLVAVTVVVHRHQEQVLPRIQTFGIQKENVGISASHILDPTSRPPAVVGSGGVVCDEHWPDSLAQQVKLMESYAAHCVYVTDGGAAADGRRSSNGCASLPMSAQDQHCLGRHPRPLLSCQLGHHRAREAPHPPADGLVVGGQGAGAGNCPIEPFVAVADLNGCQHGCDLFELQDAAEDLVLPMQDRPVGVDRETLTLGDAGVYGSFLAHAESAAERYGVDVRTLLVGVGKRGLVGGQEDMITDIALDEVSARWERLGLPTGSTVFRSRRGDDFRWMERPHGGAWTRGLMLKASWLTHASVRRWS